MPELLKPPPIIFLEGVGLNFDFTSLLPTLRFIRGGLGGGKKKGNGGFLFGLLVKVLKKTLVEQKRKKERKIRLQVLHMKILFYITGMILVFQENEFCDERFFENGTKYFCIHRRVSSNWNLWGNRIVIRICTNNFYYFEYFMLFLMI